MLAQNIRLVAGTATVFPFTMNGASQQVLAANASRLDYSIFNPSALALNANGDNLYVKFSAGAAQDGTSWEILPGGYFPPPGMAPWTGPVFLEGANGVLPTVVEFT